MSDLRTPLALTKAGQNGGGEIRTHETLAGLPVFKTGAFGRSATPPDIILSYFSSVFRSFRPFSKFSSPFQSPFQLFRDTMPAIRGLIPSRCDTMPRQAKLQKH